jgi:branched-chain amino acid transport system ATP-binding protein
MNETPSLGDPGFSLRGDQPPQRPAQVPPEHLQWAPPEVQAQQPPPAEPAPAAEAAPPAEPPPAEEPLIEVGAPVLAPTATADAAMEGTGLKVRNLKVFYGPVPAVRGVNLDGPPGRVVGVIGANGAGKTSLLSGIAGLVKTQGGSIELDGRDITGWPAHRRGQAGIVYVAERRRVFPSLSVRENLTVGGWGLDKAEVNLRVEKIFTMFPRLKEREKVPSFRLSGGEQRMVSIGRALVTGARVILFDELSLGLAPRIVAELIGTMRSLADEGRIIVLVEQYIGVLLKAADTIDVLERGRVRFSGPTNDAAAWLEENGYMAHAKTAGARAGAQSPATAATGEGR